MTISEPVFLLGESKKCFQCYYSCRLVCFFNGLWWCLFLFQLERDVAAGLLAKPWSGWGPHCYDSSQWVSSGKILGLYAWDFSQEDEATLTHLCKSLIWKLHWKLGLRILTSLQMFALKQKKNCHRDYFFFWCMKWVSFCYDWISAVEILATALNWISALWCEATPDLQVSTCGAKEEFTLLLHLV